MASIAKNVRKSVPFHVHELTQLQQQFGPALAQVRHAKAMLAQQQPITEAGQALHGLYIDALTGALDFLAELATQHEPDEMRAFLDYQQACLAEDEEILARHARHQARQTAQEVSHA